MAGRRTSRGIGVGGRALVQAGASVVHAPHPVRGAGRDLAADGHSAAGSVGHRPAEPSRGLRLVVLLLLAAFVAAGRFAG